MHLILKSSKAVGRMSFGHSSNVGPIKKRVDRLCSKYSVKLMMYSNNFNHLHFLLKFPSRAIYLRFVRSLAAAVAMIATGAKKNKRAESRFFDARPFTRIVRGLRAYKIVCDYVRLNQLEAEGTIPYQKARLRNLSEVEKAYF